MFVLFFKTPIYQSSTDFSAWFLLTGKQHKAFYILFTKSVLMSSLFWNVTQHWLVIGYGAFGTAYWTNPQGSRTTWLSKMRLINIPKKSVTNDQSTLLDFREERKPDIANEAWNRTIYLFLISIGVGCLLAARQPPPWVHTCHEISIICKSLCH